MKDFSNLQKLIEEKGELKAKEIKELGYSAYDINLFLSSNLLVRKDRGIYSLPVIEEIKEEISPQEESEQKDDVLNKIIDLSKRGTYELSKRFYAEAEKYFQEVLNLDPNNDYAYYCLSMISAAKKDYASSLELLKKNLELGNYEKNISSNYILVVALSHLTEIDPDFIKLLEEKFKSANFDAKTKKFLNQVLSPLKRKEYEKCSKKMYFINYKFKKLKKYNISNDFITLLVNAILEERKIVTSTDSKLETPIVEEQLPLKDEQEEVVIVPDVNDSILINNALLLDYISKGEYEKARDILRNNSLTKEQEIIDVLLSKLISIQAILFGSTPTKVVSIEPVRVIEQKSIDAEVESYSNLVPKSVTQSQQISASQVETLSPKGAPNPELKKELTSSEIDEKINQVYAEFKQNREDFDFDKAKKSLTRYELLYKQSGKYRNIKYHYDRLETNKEEYNRNPEQYKKKLEAIEKIKQLIALKQYDEALELLHEIALINPKDYMPIILMARVYNKTSRYEESYNLLLPYYGLCEEPSFFFQMAEACYNIGKYNDALDCCISYSERRPNRNAALFMLKADCYNKMRKYSKELRALRKAEEINHSIGYNKPELEERIAKAASNADRNRTYILAKKNRLNIDSD